MAFQVGSACYASELEAAQAQASTSVGAIVGSTPHTVSVAAIDATSITYVLSPIGGGVAITHVAPFTPQPCNLLELEDGMQIGWMVAAVWIGVYAVLSLTRALRGETGDSYGNT